MDLRQFPRHISSAFENADQRLSHSPLYDWVSSKSVPWREIFLKWLERNIFEKWLQNRQYMFSSKSLTVENELAVQAGTSCRESTKAYLVQNFILKVPIFRFPRQKCCKLSFLRQKGCFKHSCMSCDRPILEAVWAKNWMIHPATKLGQGAGPGKKGWNIVQLKL